MFALLLGLRSPRAAPAALCFAAVGCAGTAKTALMGPDPVPGWLVLMGTLLFLCVLPWLGGRYWRQSRALTAAGWLRAARLEEEQRLTGSARGCASGPGSPRTCTTPWGTN
ncbi:hypothetical protein SHKM778_05320 [Streptomyces sp. KM77-8]|uniref:Uncharacterized protein n=1 Tax=Streptomyces haneummycinicus TaxID=3074435 RepID=A0AAT9H9T3_9ACTN